MLFNRTRKKVTWFTADAPQEDRTKFQYEESDIARLHHALCGLAEFADRTDRANLNNVRIGHTSKGDIFMGDVDYVNEDGKHIAYTLNCVIGATHRSLELGKEGE